ncbi:AMP-binding protein [Lacimicrobium sp. SS2-24]|uniref:AMP-binding protein n=1 Tax=Lacimicrobium sp. SS2-24 TaxID=2005569 RepID=UPI000B4AAAE9|nr:AMP-binding protein [Lacimicrobium sp. SS2-24]
MTMTPDPKHWTTVQVLDRQSQERPDQLAIRFIDGPSYTFSELRQLSIQISSGLAAQGIAAQSKVASLLENCPELVGIWLGCHQLDAVFVGLNPALKGPFLAHSLTLSEAQVVICHQAHLAMLESMANELTCLHTVFVVDSSETTQLPNIKVLPFSHLYDTPIKTQHPQACFSDLAALIFTSGTTGPSKAVMMPHAHCYLYGQGCIDNLELTSDGRYYITLPLFHANGLFMQLYACLIAGAEAVIRRKFSASQWLHDVCHYQITHTNLLGVMAEFITSQPTSNLDRAHHLRVIAAAPASAERIDLFEQRFGIQMVELYGMSEVNIPLYTPLSAPRPGSCGKAYHRYFEVRIANPHTDLPCHTDEVGEIQVRPKIAGCFMSGYYRMPEATLQAWRNLWFHTGDAGFQDKDDYFYFVDRLSDCLRRRGENISSYEVESALLTHPDISECAVIGVTAGSIDNEQEVMAVIVSDIRLNFEEVLLYATEHIPAYALPRYFRQVSAEALPRTSTNKLRKVVLREQGVTEDTWDANHPL